MNSIQVRSWSTVVAVSALIVAIVLSATPVEAGRSVTGELVVTNASHNQFRLVGHGGSFTAPSSVAVESLDGKPVQVELSSNGRVTSIRALDLAEPQVTSSYQVVSGQMQVLDPVRRTFTLAGDTQHYLAESWIDLRPYDRRMVKFRVGSDGKVDSFELIDDRRAALPAPETCARDGRTYFSGALLCQGGSEFRCEQGDWRNLGTACSIEHTASGTQSCTFGRASVAEGSSICLNGTTFRCASGEWVDLGAPCG